MKSSLLRFLKVLVGLLLTTLAIWLSFRNIDWPLLSASLSKISWAWVLLALANVVFSVYALGWRWRILLDPKDRISMKALFRWNVLSQYVNILMPGRFGEVFRAYVGSRESCISAAFSIGTVAVERIFDFFVFAVLWLIIPVLFSIKEQVRGSVYALFFSVLMVALLCLSILQPAFFLKTIDVFSGLLPQKIRPSIRGFFEEALEAFKILRRPIRFFSILGLTAFFLIGQILTNFFLFKAYHFSLSFWASLFLLLVVQVGNVPPSAPGKIGIFEYAVILALSVFGVSKSQALSYGIMLHLVAFLPKIILGMFFISSIDLRALKRENKTLESKA